MMATSSVHPADASKVKSPLLDQMRRAVRVRHYSIRTEQAYADWVYRFILFHGVIFPQPRTRLPRVRKTRELLQRVGLAAMWAAAFFLGRRPS